MASRPPIISVPKSLYKHFAVLTVAITACVAMFADGEKREEIAEQIAEHQATKAQQMRETQRKRQAMVAGMQDNRGYVVNGNPDVGSGPVDAPILGALPEHETREFGEYERPPKSRRQLGQTTKRKLPPGLPPGMSAVPGTLDEDAAVMFDRTAA
jgi:hypothetical protein